MLSRSNVTMKVLLDLHQIQFFKDGQNISKFVTIMFERMVLNQEIELKGVHTNDHVADIFTKALAKSKFECFRVSLGVIDRKHALKGSITNYIILQCIFLFSLFIIC